MNLDFLAELKKKALGIFDKKPPPPELTPQQKLAKSMKVTYGVSPNFKNEFNADLTNLPAPVVESLPASGDFKFQMGLKDYKFTRPQVERLLKEKGSPLAGQLDEFIKAGEAHGIDPRVLVSIANNESSLGKHYPTDSFNPFGYIVRDPSWPAPANNDEQYQQILQGLRNAGFTSLPHAIDRLTNRFQRQPTEGYKTFYNDPTFSNLQKAYNANPKERDEQMKNFEGIQSYYQ